MWDDILTKTNAAWALLVVIAGGAIKLLVTARSQISDLSSKLAKDRAGEQVLNTETRLQIGWMQSLVEGQTRDAAKIQLLEKRIDDYGETRVNDARMLERKDAELVACRERTVEMKIERDLALEDMVKAREMLAAEREHTIVVEGQMLSYRIANTKLFSALPDGTRQEMLELLLKPESKS
jgi:hypothetical protein